MIINAKPLSLIEAKKYLPKDDRAVYEYMKNFAKADKEKAKKLREVIVSLNNPKIKESHIAKIIDFSPEDAEDIHKIFIEASLSEEEVSAILNLLQK